MLRWRCWPFGEVKDRYDFVLNHRGKQDLAEVELVREGEKCVFDITD